MLLTRRGNHLTKNALAAFYKHDSFIRNLKLTNYNLYLITYTQSFFAWFGQRTRSVGGPDGILTASLSLECVSAHYSFEVKLLCARSGKSSVPENMMCSTTVGSFMERSEAPGSYAPGFA